MKGGHMLSAEDVFTRLFSLPLYHEEIPHVHKVRDFTLPPTKKLILLVFGPSGAGKDSVICPLLASGVLTHVVTATTRRRRYKFLEGTDPAIEEKIKKELDQLNYPDFLDRLDVLHKEGFLIAEPREAYVWMPQYEPDTYGSYESYCDSLVRSYGLVEWDVHHGNLYGLPHANILKAGESKGVPVIRTENNGVRTLLRKLDDFSCVSLGILPDSFEEITSRIQKRSSDMQGENFETRLNESLLWIREMEELAHLVLLNSKNSFEGKSGLDSAVSSLEKLVRHLSD